MNQIMLIAALLTATLLTACDEKPNKPPVPQTESGQSAPKLFEAQREALNKAKGVEQTVGQASQELNKVTEKAAGE